MKKRNIDELVSVIIASVAFYILKKSKYTCK